jgi:hypothetical protein
MEIAKYIGLFLLKNHYCYIHGLGNMELKKRPATYDGSSLQAPSYEVVVTQGGSIDDNLANFIATSEQISISKAANELREYSIQARKDIAEGKEVPVPNIGRFVEENSKVKFITDDNFRFTPAGIPTVKNSKQLDEQNSKLLHKPSYPPPHKADSVNWSMVILVVVLLIIIGGGVFGIWYYTNMNNNTSAAVVPAKDTVVKAANLPSAPDTALVKKDTVAIAATPPAVDSMQVSPYKMVIGDYRTKAKADFRIQTLTKNGNRVEMIPQDSTNFLVITTINCRAVDTTHVKDSLRRLFGFKGVAIVK